MIVVVMNMIVAKNILYGSSCEYNTTAVEVDDDHMIVVAFMMIMVIII